MVPQVIVMLGAFATAIVFAIGIPLVKVYSRKIDAETKKPIPDADVHISYPMTQATAAPYDSVEKTGTNGTAQLRAASYGDGGLIVEAAAKGSL